VREIDFLIVGFVVLAVAGISWQFSFIAKQMTKNFKSIGSNPVLKGEKGKAQQFGLILMLVVTLVWIQLAARLF
jgi:ABC-type phosphate transport system permease subunit